MSKARNDGATPPQSTRWDLVAPPLIMVAPAVSFAAYHEYSYLAVEWLAGALLLAVMGLLAGLLLVAAKGFRLLRAAVLSAPLVLFVDLQFPDLLQTGSLVQSALFYAGAFIAFLVLAALVHQHATQIATVIFAAILGGTLLFPPPTAPPQLGTIAVEKNTNRELPPIIHIVLDEFIGLEGIPTDIKGGRELKNDLKSFFQENGFHVYGKAFSRFFQTFESMAHALNPDRVLENNLIKYSNNEWIKYDLDRSNYLSEFTKKGYYIDIYQFDYLNYCNSIILRLATCNTVRAEIADRVENLSVPWTGKFRVLVSLYFSQSLVWRGIRKAYRTASATLTLPVWDWERTSISNLAADKTLDLLKRDLRKATGGEYYFAHVLAPHTPHIFNRDCMIDEPTEWTEFRIAEGVSKSANTPASRRHRYRRYFEQVRCLQKQLGELFAIIRENPNLADAIVILHGDHGSRITLTEPRSEDRKRLVPSDLVDGYSTLFAIRSPGLRRGYDLRLAPLQGLFRYFMVNGFSKVPDTNDDLGEAFVFLRWWRQSYAERVMPMVQFGEPATGKPLPSATFRSR
jgi:hypothetical protein